MPTVISRLTLSRPFFPIKAEVKERKNASSLDLMSPKLFHSSLFTVNKLIPRHTFDGSTLLHALI
jgi:hypothetical protein